MSVLSTLLYTKSIVSNRDTLIVKMRQFIPDPAITPTRSYIQHKSAVVYITHKEAATRSLFLLISFY